MVRAQKVQTKVGTKARVRRIHCYTDNNSTLRAQRRDTEKRERIRLLDPIAFPVVASQRLLWKIRICHYIGGSVYTMIYSVDGREGKGRLQVLIFFKKREGGEKNEVRVLRRGHPGTSEYTDHRIQRPNNRERREKRETNRETRRKYPRSNKNLTPTRIIREYRDSPIQPYSNAFALCTPCAARF